MSCWRKTLIVPREMESYKRNNLLFARHAANEYYGWVKIVKGLSPKPMGQYDKQRYDDDSIINFVCLQGHQTTNIC